MLRTLTFGGLSSLASRSRFALDWVDGTEVDVCEQQRRHLLSL